MKNWMNMYKLLIVFSLSTDFGSWNVLAQFSSSSSSESLMSSREDLLKNPYATPNCTCGMSNKQERRIIGGRVTETFEFPFMAGLVHLEKDILVCGSTILTERHIVTAAHCTVDFKPNQIGIHVGHHNYHEVKDFTRLLEPEKFYIHEKFDEVTLGYDISVILMKQPLEFSNQIGPACLPTGDISLEGRKVKALGWGRQKYRGKLSDVLLKVDLLVHSLETCVDDNPYLFLDDNHQLCTYKEGKDTCNGDSGGPLLWKDRTSSSYILVAVTSYGYNCAKYPAVSSSVVHFLPWIQQIISRTDPSYRTCALL